MKQNPTRAIFLSLIVVTATPILQAGTNLVGDYTVTASGSEPGNLEVAGDLSTWGGLDLGTTNVTSPPSSAFQIYFSGGAWRGGRFDLTEGDASFLWRDNLADAARNKMGLDENNNLTLFNESGTTANIVLSGSSGRVTLNGEGSGVYSGNDPILTLDGEGDVKLGTGRNFQVDGGTPSVSSVTGSLTVDGGIGVGMDSYFNGVRIGKGGGNEFTCTAIGADALKVNTGITNTAVGYSALSANQYASWNTAVGSASMLNNTIGEANAAFGAQSLLHNTSGTWNVGIGGNALYSNTIGSSNTAVGVEALFSATTSDYNTGIGKSALQNHTTGGGNTALGTAALAGIATSFANTAIGGFAMLSSLSGDRNTVIGGSGAYYLTSGSNNVVVGAEAAAYQADGFSILTHAENSIYIGTKVRGLSNTDENVIVIGHEAVSEGANTTVIGNTATTRAKIHGAVETPRVTATASQGDALVVEGDSLLKGNAVIQGQVTLQQAQGDINMGIYQ